MDDRHGHLRPAATIEPLGLPPREALEAVRQCGYGAAQLSAAQPGLRPRELDQSARRDLVATLRRLEIACAGVDLWIPLAHFNDPARIDRAVGSMLATIEFAADLGRVMVSTLLPDEGAARDTIVEHALRQGIAIVDFGNGGLGLGANVESDSGASPEVGTGVDPGVGPGVDPAAILARGVDPVDFVIINASAIRSARLCDLTIAGMRAPLGEPDGMLDTEAYRAALSTCDHLGSMVVDARQWTDVERGLRRTLEAWNTGAVR